MTDFYQAMHDPDGTFHNPANVLKDTSLTKEQKIKILEEWELDARELQVAEEENMPGNRPTKLSRIHDALLKIREMH